MLKLNDILVGQQYEMLQCGKYKIIAAFTWIFMICEGRVAENFFAACGMRRRSSTMAICFEGALLEVMIFNLIFDKSAKQR